MGKFKKVVVFILAMILVFSFTGCGGSSNSSNSSNGKIIIGYIGPITGEMAIYGEAESRTLKMLIEDTNKKRWHSGQTD